MAYTFGQEDAAATKVVRALSQDSARVRWTEHAEEEMDNDGFDHAVILQSLRKGVAYGPEHRNGKSRYNVVHRGNRVRIVVELHPQSSPVSSAQRVVVTTVMSIA